MFLTALGERLREAGEDAAWFVREHLAWPIEDASDRVGGTRAAVGIFGGGGVAVAALIAAILIFGSGGSGTTAGPAAVKEAGESAPAGALAVAPKPKPAKPSGPTLHGAPPDFASDKDVRAGVGDGAAVGDGGASTGVGGAPAERGGAAAAGNSSTATGAATAGGSAAASGGGTPGTDASGTDSADDASAATAKIGATP